MLIQWLKRKIFNLIRDDIREMCERYVEAQNGKNSKFENHLLLLETETEKQNGQICDIKKSFTDLKKKIFEQQEVDKSYARKLLMLEENIQGDNQLIKELQQGIRSQAGLIEDIGKVIDSYEKDITESRKINGNHTNRLLTLEENMRSNNKRLQGIVETMELDNPYSLIDYGQFENNFRGSRDLIKQRQQIYVPYFKEKKNVLDLGCGRGEFLELMHENGIQAVGVDLYQPFVDQCGQMGFEVYHQDALEYLRKCQLVDGIFFGQVAEHLHVAELIQFCGLAYEKLLPGGCLIIETPNPTCLAIYSHAFYADPTHTRPVHPETLRYYLHIAGFRNIEIVYTDSSRLPTRIPVLESDRVVNLDEFNESMKEVSDQLFGSRDYAAVAIKQ